MKVPVWILTLAVGGMLTVEGWICSTLIDLKTDVAALKATAHDKQLSITKD